MVDRVIRVTVDASGVAAGANRARRPLEQLDRRQQALQAGARRLRQALVGVAAAFSVRELVRTADTYQTLENQLRIVTDSTEELTNAQDRLFEIAQDTRAPLEATVELFSRASIAADELGASQEQLFRLTEITGQALAVQGGSAQEASGALRQLSQSFASGIVRAEEFNSILEGAFPLAQAAARGIDEAGGSVGRLRQLVAEGEITSREFFEGILRGSDDISAAFGQTLPTVGQTITLISNSFTVLVGRINQATGFTRTLSQFIIELANDIGTFTDAVLGTLEPTDRLSEGLQTISIAAILAGDALQVLINTGKVATSAFTDIGASVGGFFAGVGAIIRGDFQEGLDILNEPALARTQEAITNLFFNTGEAFEDSAQKIREILIPALREAREEGARLAEQEPPPPVVDPATVTALERARGGLEDYIAQQTQVTTELRLTANAGEDAGEAITQYREALAFANAEQELFGELAPGETVDELRETFRDFAIEAIESQRALRAEIEAAELEATFDAQIEALEEELESLRATNEELAINAELRALAGGATEAQAAQIRELTLALAQERDALDAEKDALADFFTEVGETAEQQLSGFLADPLAEGLDELPFKFIQTINQLAAQALASETFKLLAGVLGGGLPGGPGAAGGGGGIASFLSGLLGGGPGLQAGGPISSGGPRLVGERGPELFQPPGSGAIVPNVNIAMAAPAAPPVNIVNVTDPADVAAGISSPQGEQEVINVIQRNPDAVRRLLG